MYKQSTYLNSFLRSSILLYALIRVKSSGGGGGRRVGLPFDPRRGPWAGLADDPAVLGGRDSRGVGAAVGLTSVMDGSRGAKL